MGGCFPRITNRHSDVKITTHLVGWINQQRENMTSLYLLTLGANISPYRITKRYTILCLHLFTHKPHLSGNALNNLQIFDDSQNWLMIVGGFVRRYFLLPLFSTKWKILPFPLYQNWQWYEVSTYTYDRDCVFLCLSKILQQTPLSSLTSEPRKKSLKKMWSARCEFFKECHEPRIGGSGK